jgi:transcriptional regulator with XRE-family HTH domain
VTLPFLPSDEPQPPNTARTLASERAVLVRLRTVVGTRSYRAIAEEIGLNAETVRRALHGDSRPSIELAIAVCRAYGVSAQWLLLGEEPKHCNDSKAARVMSLAELAEDIEARTRSLTTLTTELLKKTMPLREVKHSRWNHGAATEALLNPPPPESVQATPASSAARSTASTDRATDRIRFPDPSPQPGTPL